MFPVLYSILLVVSFCFGSVYVVEPLIVRYFAMLVLAAACLSERYLIPRNGYLWLYVIFILFYAFTSFTQGYAEDFLKLFVGYYLNCFLWIWATWILIVKYRATHVLIYSFLAICLMNALITIGQHFLNPIAFSIPRALDVMGVDKMDSMIEKSDDVVKEFALPGLMGPFQNGYYAAVGCVVSLYMFARNKKWLWLALWPLFLYALFCVGERAALVGGLAFSVLYLVKVVSSSRSSFVLAIFVCLLGGMFFYLPGNDLDMSSAIEGTRYESFDFDSRTGIYSKAVNYIILNPMTANMFDFNQQTNLYPHHLIYNAFICGTFVGGIIILGVLGVISLKVLRILMGPLTEQNKTLVMLAFAFFCYNMVSFTHNNSIVTGDVLFWLITTPMLVHFNYSRQSKANIIRSLHL